MSIKPLKRKPSTKQRSANGTRRRISGAASAPATPHPPHASICHGVQGPCPRKKFETRAASAPTPKPARAPSAAPAATATTVTGCTPGIAAKMTRPAAAAAARVATRTSVFPAPRLGSSQAAPATRSAAATRRSDSAPRPGDVAAQAAPANATNAAPPTTSLDMGRLPLGRERDDAIGNAGREREIVGDEQRCAVVGRSQQACELELALRVDSAGRLVENEQIRSGSQHRGQREAL